MIKLFRNIRFDLIASHQFGRYVKYAIGEIVLVVAGILIALALNSWNADRLQVKRNKLLLQRLSSELDHNIARCEYIDTVSLGFRERVGISDSILRILDRGIKLDDLEMFSEGPVYYTATLNLNAHMFEELKNTGSLYSIGSDTLVHAIQEYYQLCSRESFYNVEFGKTVLNRQETCYKGFYRLLATYMTHPERVHEVHDWLFDPISDEYLDLVLYMNLVNVHSNIMVEKLDGIVEESEALKALIAEEIHRMY